MKHDLTTGTWQDDTGCPISIVLAATSDVCDDYDSYSNSGDGGGDGEDNNGGSDSKGGGLR